MAFYIRVDGNEEIMTGHIMRCLSIAKAARFFNVQTIFILADDTMKAFIEEQDFSTICLDTRWNRMEPEIEILLQKVSFASSDVLLVDSYSATPAYFEKLPAFLTVAYMDDLGETTYPVDYLVNYNHYASVLCYDQKYTNIKTRFLLGCQYAPLREEFTNLPPFVCKDTVLKLLITTGGSDTYNAADLFTKAMQTTAATKKLEVHIVAGRFNPHLDALHELSQQYSGVIVHHNVKNMSQLMQQCDIAITAGGSTLYELCACGIPSIFFSFADNQLLAEKAFKNSIMLYAGDIRNNTQQCTNNVVNAVCQYMADFSLRQMHSKIMQQLVDGQGADRLVKALLF